jgi:hypothetical protein
VKKPYKVLRAISRYPSKTLRPTLANKSANCGVTHANDSFHPMKHVLFRNGIVLPSGRAIPSKRVHYIYLLRSLRQWWLLTVFRVIGL